MTKTLTEQWKNGVLPNGNYYTICSGWNMQTFPCIVYCERNCFDAHVIEVLAPVPSYDEFKQLVSKTEQLEKKLEIATNALERIHQPAVGDIYNFETDELDHTKLQDIAYKALKEMEGVK